MWGKKDYLRGLKENVIMGRIIPAGTGMARYQNIGIQIDAPAELLEGPEEDVAPDPPSAGLDATLEAPEMLASPSSPGGAIKS